MISMPLWLTVVLKVASLVIKAILVGDAAKLELQTRLKAAHQELSK